MNPEYCPLHPDNKWKEFSKVKEGKTVTWRSHTVGDGDWCNESSKEVKDAYEAKPAPQPIKEEVRESIPADVVSTDVWLAKDRMNMAQTAQNNATKIICSLIESGNKDVALNARVFLKHLTKELYEQLEDKKAGIDEILDETDLPF